MVGEAPILLSSSLEAFAAPRPKHCGDILVGTAPPVVAAQHGEFVAPAYQGAVGKSAETPAVTQHIEGVEKVALTHAVVAQQAVDARRELERCARYVFKSGEGKALYYHSARLKNSLKNSR